MARGKGGARVVWRVGWRWARGKPEDVCPRVNNKDKVKKMKLIRQTDICTLKFIAAVFITAEIWKQTAHSQINR